MSTLLSYDIARCDTMLVLESDPHVKFPHTIAALRSALAAVQEGMSKLLHRTPTSMHEHVAWVLLNGCRALYATCEPLVVLGHSSQVLEFLSWAVLTMEAVTSLSSTRHLRWRMRLYAAIAYAYEDMGKVQGAVNLVSHATQVRSCIQCALCTDVGC